MMLSPWFHPVLAANGDAQTLIDLLITVIFIVIWLAGSIVRANTNKPSARRRSRVAANKSLGTDSSSTKRSTFASPSFMARWEEMAQRIEAGVAAEEAAEAEKQRLKQEKQLSDTKASQANPALDQPVLTYEQRQAWDQTMESSLDSPSSPIFSPNNDRDRLKSIGHIDGLTQSRLTGVGPLRLEMGTTAPQPDDLYLDIDLPTQWDRDQLAQAIVSLEIISEPLALRDSQARFMV